MVCRVNRCRYQPPISRAEITRELIRYRKFLREARAVGDKAAILNAEAYISAVRAVAKYIAKKSKGAMDESS